MASRDGHRTYAHLKDPDLLQKHSWPINIVASYKISGWDVQLVGPTCTKLG